jgi:RNA polymerase nonessential primary-like sigma factor
MANTQPKSNGYSPDMVRTYLHEIGRVPMLTHEQEIIFGKQVQKMMELQDKRTKLAEKLGHAPTPAEFAASVKLTEAEVKQLLDRGHHAKQRMIEANLRLVVSIAKKYQKRNLEFLDLIQEGSLGLERGVEKFDPMRGYKFSTYAYWWIRQAITRAIAQQSRTIRLPIHITEKLNRIKRTQRELAQSLGREYLVLSRQPVSLDLRVGDNQDTELQDLLEDDGDSPETYTIRQLLRQDLGNLLAELTPQQQLVLTLRYGLGDEKEMSLAKVGVRLNLSRERVRQLERQALEHLRRRKAMVLEYMAS